MFTKNKLMDTVFILFSLKIVLKSLASGGYLTMNTFTNLTSIKLGFFKHTVTDTFCCNSKSATDEMHHL